VRRVIRRIPIRIVRFRPLDIAGADLVLIGAADDDPDRLGQDDRRADLAIFLGVRAVFLDEHRVVDARPEGRGVRLIIASSTRTSSVELPLAEAAQSVAEGGLADEEQLAGYPAVLTPGDGEIRAAVEAMRVSSARLARYYLRSLEMTAKNESEPWYIPHNDKAIINLEHILPKKVEGNWPGFSDEDVRRLSTWLGNLARMRASDNSDLRSQAFTIKESRLRRVALPSDDDDRGRRYLDQCRD
jgi:hypothetical protein